MSIRRAVVVCAVLLFVAACATGVSSTTTTPPSARTTTTEPAPTSTPAATTTTTEPIALLADVELDSIVDYLWLLMPPREVGHDLLGMADHSWLWWDTGGPSFVAIEEWWTGAGFGAGHLGISPNRAPDVSFQFGVWEKSEDAEVVVERVATQRRFADRSIVQDDFELPEGVNGFGLVLDRAADDEYIPEGEAVEAGMGPYGPDGYEQVWLAVFQLDRVVAAVATHGNDKSTEPQITELVSIIAGRADRFGVLLEDSPYPPSRHPQPLPWLMFGGAGPTLADLGIPTELEVGPWSVASGAWDSVSGLEVFYEGEPFSGIELESGSVVGGWDRELGIEEALMASMNETFGWMDETPDVDYRFFEDVNGYPAMRGLWTEHEDDTLVAAQIDVRILSGHPMTSFWLASWGEFAEEDLDPELVADAVVLVDQLLLEASS